MKPFSAMPAYQEIIDVLRSAVSDTGLITDPADISAAALDGRGRRQGEALARLDRRGFSRHEDCRRIRTLRHPAGRQY